jgi:hypothetical protein
LTTSINDTGGKFASRVNDTGGKTAAGINDTGGKFATGINAPAANFATSFTSVVDTGVSTIWRQICRWCQRHLWSTLSCEYLRKFSKKSKRS